VTIEKPTALDESFLPSALPPSGAPHFPHVFFNAQLDVLHARRLQGLRRQRRQERDFAFPTREKKR